MVAFPRPLLVATGKALYGEQWQSALARDIGISDRHMRRWFAGDNEISDGVWDDLMRLLVDRGQTIDALVERIKIG